MNIESSIQIVVAEAIKSIYNTEVTSNQIQLQKTKKEFEGDITVVVFPYSKIARKSPEVTAQEIGEYILTNNTLITNFNVIKGFLNLSINKSQIKQSS